MSKRSKLHAKIFEREWSKRFQLGEDPPKKSENGSQSKKKPNADVSFKDMQNGVTNLYDDEQ